MPVSERNFAKYRWDIPIDFGLILKQRVADVRAAAAKTMADLVDNTTEIPPYNSPASQPEKLSPITSQNLWFQYCSTAFLSIWHELENILFYTGIHPSYIIFRINMAFQLLAGRLSPFLGVASSRDTKKGDNDISGSDAEEEAIALRAQTRTMNVKRRRAQVAEHSFHGVSVALYHICDF